MNRLILQLCLLFVPLTLAQAQSRGELISAELVRTVPQAEIETLLASATTGIPSFIVNLIAPVRRDVEIYKLRYYTPAPDGSLVVGSGAVFVPKNYPCRATLVTYLHGTLTDDISAPSNGIGDEAAIGYVYAANARYIAIMPDYLGLGDRGEGTLNYHPYQHAPTAATTSIDMIRAANTFIRNNGFRINDQHFLLGYSQGGHAVLSTLRELQENRAEYPVLNFTYSIAGSGPYDLSGVQKEFVFAKDVYDNPSFFPYILQAYQPIYGNIFNNPSEVFAPGFENTLDLFDGSRDVEQLDSLLPLTWKDMFRDEYLQSVQFDPNNTTSLALQDNNVIDWVPESDLRLYYCNLDELVTIDNALRAWINFFLRGAGFRVSLASAGDFKHRECAPFVAFLSKIAFDSRRNNRFCLTLEAPEDEEFASQNIPEEYLEELNRLRRIAEDQGMDEIQSILEEHGYFKVSKLVELQGQDPASYVSFYPNPVEAKAQVDLTKLPVPVSAVNVYDFTGKLVQSFQDLNGQTSVEIDGGSWQKGLYLVKVQTDAQQLAQELSQELGAYAKDLAYHMAQEIYTFKMVVE